MTARFLFTLKPYTGQQLVFTEDVKEKREGEQEIRREGEKKNSERAGEKERRRI